MYRQLSSFQFSPVRGANYLLLLVLQNLREVCFIFLSKKRVFRLDLQNSLELWFGKLEKSFENSWINFRKQLTFGEIASIGRQNQIQKKSRHVNVNLFSSYKKKRNTYEMVTEVDRKRLKRVFERRANSERFLCQNRIHPVTVKELSSANIEGNASRSIRGSILMSTGEFRRLWLCKFQLMTYNQNVPLTKKQPVSSYLLKLFSLPKPMWSEFIVNYTMGNGL